jgi:hypothetical protein
MAVRGAGNLIKTCSCFKHIALTVCMYDVLSTSTEHSLVKSESDNLFYNPNTTDLSLC